MPRFPTIAKEMRTHRGASAAFPSNSLEVESDPDRLRLSAGNRIEDEGLRLVGRNILGLEAVVSIETEEPVASIAEAERPQKHLSRVARKRREHLPAADVGTIERHRPGKGLVGHGEPQIGRGSEDRHFLAVALLEPVGRAPATAGAARSSSGWRRPAPGIGASFVLPRARGGRRRGNRSSSTPARGRSRGSRILRYRDSGELLRARPRLPVRPSIRSPRRPPFTGSETGYGTRSGFVIRTWHLP